jgi:kynurenine 3-monooxygenase
MDFDKSLVFFANDLDGNVTRLEADTVIGTDGSASALRMDFLKTGHFNFSQTYENYGYKELHIPAALGGGFRLEQNALHIWPRGAYMMIALPNKEGDFTCTLFISYDKGDRHLKQLDTPHKVKAFFAEVFPDALPHMPCTRTETHSQS